MVDVSLALVVGAILIIQVAVASEPGSRDVDPIAYGLVLLIAAMIVLRRRQPVAVLVASVIVLYGYHALNYPAIGLSIPLAVPLYTVALLGGITGVVVIVFSLASTLGWLLLGESQPLLDGLNIVVREGAIMVAVVMAGSAYRSRRLLSDETIERIRLARVEQDAEVVAERMRIARELHDVVAHTVTVIGVQSKVAAEAIDDDISQARRALDVISRATREATSELRTTVAVLRQGETPPLSPVSSLADLETLIDSVRAGGLPVRLSISGPDVDIPGSAQLTAYRVVQESLTNVVKHANADSAEVKLEKSRERLVVTVTDDGRGGDGVRGHGIRGMIERVAAHGGLLESGPVPDRGFRVRAEIPL